MSKDFIPVNGSRALSRDVIAEIIVVEKKPGRPLFDCDVPEDGIPADRFTVTVITKRQEKIIVDVDFADSVARLAGFVL